MQDAEHSTRADFDAFERLSRVLDYPTLSQETYTGLLLVFFLYAP